MFQSEGKDGVERTTSRAGIDDLLGSALNRMSVEERTEGLHDLHGVADLVAENPEFLQQKTEQMNMALDDLCESNETGGKSDTQAFTKAWSLSRDYVERLKVPCIRAENYNAQEAAGRMLRFFEMKRGLFGDGELVADIKLNNLGAEATNAVRQGLFQILPHRDRAGRALLLVSGFGKQNYSTKTIMRALYYMTMTAQKEEETQRKGCVIITYLLGEKSSCLEIVERAAALMHGWRALQLRVVAVHTCVDNSEILHTVYSFCRLMDDKKLSRFRLHTGTHTECVCALQTFGILKNSLPDDISETKRDLTSHLSMLSKMESRQEKKQPPSEGQMKVDDDMTETESSWTEAATKTANATCVVPGPMDVLMGRGRHPKSRPGALRLRQLVLESREVYDAATSKTQKTRITAGILERMKEDGCRFLSPTDGDGAKFVECDDTVARDKISHVFRNLRLNKPKRRSSGKKQENETKKA